LDIQGKVVVVTGGASGLGLAAAKAFHNKGAQVNLFDLNEEAGLSVTQEIGNGCAFFQVNVTDESSVQQAIDDIVAKLGAIHVVLNCAGIGPPEKAIDRDGHVLPLEKFKRIIDINLVGSFNVLSKAVGYMAKQAAVTEDGGRGVIINVASVAAFDGQIGQPAYAASKAGIVGMALPLAREFARYGVRVNTIAPGLFLTPLAESLGEKVVDALGQAVEYPKRLGRPEEFAHWAVAMVENDYLNGEVIRLDGAIRMSAK